MFDFTPKEQGSVMSEAVYRFGAFTVDTRLHALLKGERRLLLQKQPFEVLLALLEGAGQVVTRETLRRRLWGTDTFVDFDQSLNSALRRLRMALEDNPRKPVFVETVPRVGFRFLPAVVVERTPSEAQVGALDTRDGLNGALPGMVPDRAAERGAIELSRGASV